MTATATAAATARNYHDKTNVLYSIGYTVSTWVFRQLMITTLLMIPGAVDLLIAIYLKGQSPNASGMINLRFDFSAGQTILGSYSLLFWSIFMVCCYASLKALSIIIALLPIAVKSILTIRGHTSHNFQIIIDYIEELKQYITAFCFLVGLTIVWSIWLEGPVVLNLIFTATVGSLFLFIQKLLVQIIAVRFHRTAYSERINELNWKSRVISHLNQVSKRIVREQILELNRQPLSKHIRHFSRVTNTRTPMESGISAHRNQIEDDVSVKSESNHQKGHYLNSVRKPYHRRAASESNHRSDATDVAITIEPSEPYPIISEGKYGLISGKPKDLKDANGLENLKFQAIFAKDSALSSNSKEAIKIAKRIFEALSRGKNSLEPIANATSDGLTVTDFQPFWENYDDAIKAFLVFDKNDNGYVTRSDIKDAIIEDFKDRQSLSESLRDVSSAVGKLDVAIGIISFILTVLVGLLIFGVSLGPYLVTSISVIVAIAVIFGNTAKNGFEGLIFLFLAHPYDVGDRVIIDKQTLIVKELGILNTVFTMWNGQIVYSPNALLSTKPIVNIRRSSCQIEAIEIHVGFETTTDQLEKLENRINDWIHQESRDFVPSTRLQPYEIENMNKIKIQMLLEHRSNWQDMEKRWSRRSKFMVWLKDTLYELGIQYSYPVQAIINSP